MTATPSARLARQSSRDALSCPYVELATLLETEIASAGTTGYDLQDTRRMLGSVFIADPDGSGHPRFFVELDVLHKAARMTLAELADRIEESTGRRYDPSAIARVIAGQRRVGSDLLTALEIAFGLPENSILVDYVPRSERRFRKTA